MLTVSKRPFNKGILSTQDIYQTVSRTTPTFTPTRFCRAFDPKRKVNDFKIDFVQSLHIQKNVHV